MGAEKRTLLSVQEVTDHDCGNYYIGEIDFAISGSLEDYLRNYGRKGRDELVRTLGYLIYRVEHTFRTMPDPDQLKEVEENAKLVERLARNLAKIPPMSAKKDDETN